VTYKLEAPYAFARDPSIRERLTRQVLADVATTRGPPEAVAKADELARIAATGKDRAPPEVRGTLRQRPAGDLRRSAVGKEPY